VALQVVLAALAATATLVSPSSVAQRRRNSARFCIESTSVTFACASASATGMPG
jgi:hypothetical protein